MKTIRQWFEEYPDPEIRDKLLRDLHRNKDIADSHNKFSSFHEALSSAFVWKDTPEGHHFWSDLGLRKRNGRVKPHVSRVL
ncbi:MAG: hypothetical protein FJ279_03565 [Planctomycetes bacterium]|nr:hypothetical protein [Planctomycetota bacterium]